jgi:hypothetical protein
MNIFMRWLLLSLVAIVSLTACASTGFPTMTPAIPRTPMPPDWQNRWLMGIPCRPPCWEGITPGTTLPDEAVMLLKQNPLFSNVQQNESGAHGEIIWNLRDGTRGGQLWYNIVGAQEIVYLIDPNLTVDFSLKDILAQYGEPSHVIAAAETLSPPGQGIGRFLKLIYQPLGFAVSVAKIPTVLSPTMETVHPVFFVPNEPGRSAAIPAPPEFISPWQGFKEYASYCYDSEGGSACKNQ